MPQFQKPTSDELDARYNYHPPKGDQGERYEFIRKKCRELASVIVNSTPYSPEQTRALNALDEVMFLANSSIARHE